MERVAKEPKLRGADLHRREQLPLPEKGLERRERALAHQQRLDLEPWLDAVGARALAPAAAPNVDGVQVGA